ncbi:MAG: FYVE zinc finger domain-containing protein [Rhodospirillales bacterium]
MTFAVRKHATGNRAKAQCARCGMVMPYKRLTLDGYKKNLWVCPDCYDPDHPQEHPVPTADAEALHHAQPLLDSGVAASTFATNRGTGGDFTINGSLADALPPVGATWGRAVRLDGANDYLSQSSGLTGAVNGQKATVSCWVNNQLSFATGNIRYDSEFILQISGGEFLHVGVGKVGSGELWNARSSVGSLTETSGFVHILVAFDLSVPVGYLYLNDRVDQTNTNGPIDDTADFTNNPTGIGAQGDNGGNKLNGDLFDYWEAHDFIDISVEANRRKFITPDRKPVDLGPDGTNPGITPIIFLSARGLGPSDSVPQLSDVLDGGVIFGGGT